MKLKQVTDAPWWSRLLYVVLVTDGPMAVLLGLMLALYIGWIPSRLRAQIEAVTHVIATIEVAEKTRAQEHERLTPR